MCVAKGLYGQLCIQASVKLPQYEHVVVSINTRVILKQYFFRKLYRPITLREEDI